MCVGNLDLSVETQHTNPLKAYLKLIHTFWVNNKHVIKEKYKIEEKLLGVEGYSLQKWKNRVREGC